MLANGIEQTNRSDSHWILDQAQRRRPAATPEEVVARRKRDAINAAGGSVTTSRPVPPVTVTDNEVARRAYDVYLWRSGEYGHDLDDWLQAEGELHAKASIA